MQAKIEQKNKAIELRKQGFSYSEILKQIPVAKSSLSLWLRSVGLSRKQKQRLTDKKLASALRGAERKKEIRIALTKKIKDSARMEVGEITERELWLIGTALYWGEGNKEKEYNPGSKMQFSNSDPNMIKVFINWLIKNIRISEDKIRFEIYIHENKENDIGRVVKYWANCTGFSQGNFSHIYFKKNKVKTNRKNIGDDYHGLLRISVINSSGLNRRIAGWIEGIYKNY